jgi:hypothetical protein
MIKHTLLAVVFFLLASSPLFSQDFTLYGNLKLEEPADYKQTEPLALSAASFLLATPYKETDENRSQALKFLGRWMSGTKEYSFPMQGMGQDIAEYRDIFGIFIAAMAKFALENKSLLTTPRIVQVNTAKLVMEYCDNPANNLPLKKKVRKFLEVH